MRCIAVVTFARSEYSNCFPILRAIRNDSDLKLHLIVSGMHLSPEFGYTVKGIEADGFEISDRVEMLLSSDTPEGEAKSVGIGTIGFAQSFSRFKPDLLLILGDRLELLSVACAALPFNIPIVHAFGGDITEGAIDNQVRHAITKLSHIHLVAMDAHAKRLVQMGEEHWRIFVTGDPALDLITQMSFMKREELSNALGLKLDPPVLVTTFHPATLGSNSVLAEIDQLLLALNQIQGTLIFTYPNADSQAQIIIERISRFVESRSGIGFYQNLGQLKYYSLLALADIMVGNSSSGLWEAPSFRLPAVNVGKRQQGRHRSRNVIDAQPDVDEIVSAIRRGLDPSFRASLQDLQNPYGDGRATPRVLKALKEVELGPRLLTKKFIDL